MLSRVDILGFGILDFHDLRVSEVVKIDGFFKGIMVVNTHAISAAFLGGGVAFGGLPLRFPMKDATCNLLRGTMVMTKKNGEPPIFGGSCLEDHPS